MEWIGLALFGAFAQAAAAAFKKKALQTPGTNNVLGCTSFAVAGTLFLLLHHGTTGHWGMNNLTVTFWKATLWYAGLTILATYFMYKALDVTNFNVLMPFMAFTSLSMVIPPMVFLGEYPSWRVIVGITLIVWGAIYIARPDSKVRFAKTTRKGLGYFFVTALCYTFTPTAAAIAIRESSSFFASMVAHWLIAAGFLLLIVICREQRNCAKVMTRDTFLPLIGVMIVAGVLIVAENGSINLALNSASVADVFALKRTMPIFATGIGVWYFREKLTLRSAIAMAVMVAGSVLVVLLH